MVDLYEILGIEPEASPADIKAAWRQQAGIHHPDKNPDDPFAQGRFQQAREAYETLSDRERRAVYDETGEDDRPRDLKPDALNIIAGLVWDALSRDGGADLVPDILVGIRLEAQKTKTSLENLATNTALLEKAKVGFRYTGRGVDFITDTIDSQINHCSDQVAKHERQLIVIEVAEQIMTDYEGSAEKRKIDWREIKIATTLISTGSTGV